jgi:hypothetical protein
MTFGSCLVAAYRSPSPGKLKESYPVSTGSTALHLTPSFQSCLAEGIDQGPDSVLGAIADAVSLKFI